LKLLGIEIAITFIIVVTVNIFDRLNFKKGSLAIMGFLLLVFLGVYESFAVR